MSRTVKVVSFIKKLSENQKVVFWPDLTSSHYSSLITKHLDSENVFRKKIIHLMGLITDREQMGEV